jgi:hypothetical protein
MKTLIFKLGNMRKAQDWVIYPKDVNKPDELIIQSDNRIAKVNLTTKKALLSDSKGGHQGFIKLNEGLGAKEVDVSEEIIALLTEQGKKITTGSVTLTSLIA